MGFRINLKWVTSNFNQTRGSHQQKTLNSVIIVLSSLERSRFCEKGATTLTTKKSWWKGGREVS